MERQESRFTLAVSERAKASFASRLADGALLIVALIWGATFVMVKDAVTGYPVLSFLALRFSFAALALLPVVLLRRGKSGPKDESPPSSLRAGLSTGRDSERPPATLAPAHTDRCNADEQSPAWGEIASAPRSGPSAPASPHGARDDTGQKPLLPKTSSAPGGSRTRREQSTSSPRGIPRRRDGELAMAFVPGLLRRSSLRVTVAVAAPLLLGLALFAGYALQTFGLRFTTPAKAGFVTGLSVVIVPVVATLVLRQMPGRGAWLGVGLATVGLALLTLNVGFSVNPGDALVFGCAVAFACQILLTGRFAPRFDPLLLTFGQILVVALLAGTAALVLERAHVPTPSVLFAAAFTGILATSLAFGVQTVAQRFTSPTRTALVFATEPVFAAIFSFLLIGEVLGPRQLAGCALILAGMVTAEVMRNGRTDGEMGDG